MRSSSFSCLRTTTAVHLGHFSSLNHALQGVKYIQLARGSANSKHRTMTVKFPIHSINDTTLLGNMMKLRFIGKHFRLTPINYEVPETQHLQKYQALSVVHCGVLGL